MESIEKIISNPDGFKKMPNWLFSIVMAADNRISMILAAWVYMFMLDRAELSLKNKWLDKDNKVYIYFTYDDVKSLLKCGTTTCWKIFKLLKKHGLISVKQQGFGLPNIIYVHTPDGRYDSVQTNAQTANEAVKTTLDELKDTFESWEIQKIEDKLVEKMPNCSDEQRNSFLKKIYANFAKVQKRKKLDNPLAYFLTMLQNAKVKNSKSPSSDAQAQSSVPYQSEPSFNLEEIFKHAKNSTPKLRSSS